MTMGAPATTTASSPAAGSIPAPGAGPRSNYLSWDDYFMSIAYLSSLRSKDPRTKVGACIVDEQSRIVGIGYNGFPTGCSDADLPWKSAKEWTNVDAKGLPPTSTSATFPAGDGGAAPTTTSSSSSSGSSTSKTTSTPTTCASKGSTVASETDTTITSRTEDAQPSATQENLPDPRAVEVDVPWLSSKYPYICHAAINAILNSHNNLHGCRLYTTLFPNDECCKLIAQAGIKEVIYGDDKYHDDDAWVAARRILDVAGISAVSFGAKSGGASSSSFSPLPSSVSGAVWWCPGRWTTTSVRESLFGDCSKMGLVDEDGKTNKHLVAKMVRILSRAAWNVWASVLSKWVKTNTRWCEGSKSRAPSSLSLTVAPTPLLCVKCASVIGLGYVLGRICGTHRSESLEGGFVTSRREDLLTLDTLIDI